MSNTAAQLREIALGIRSGRLANHQVVGRLNSLADDLEPAAVHIATVPTQEPPPEEPPEKREGEPPESEE